MVVGSMVALRVSVKSGPESSGQAELVRILVLRLVFSSYIMRLKIFLSKSTFFCICMSTPNIPQLYNEVRNGVCEMK